MLGTKAAGGREIVLLLAVLIALVVLPFLVKPYMLNMLILIIYSAYLAQSWNVMGGYAGQFSFGHAAFFGLGAYTTALLFVHWHVSPWFGMLVGASFAAVTGLVIGYLCFRYGLKGPYFVLATLAFAEILRVITVNWMAVNGPMGILLPLEPGIINYQFDDRISFYFVILIMLAGVTLVVRQLSISKPGFYFVAIRENEDAAQALGVDTFRYKLISVAISAFFTALGGTFYVQYFSYIDPSLAFGVDVSVSILAPAIIGGAGTVLGPLIGSVVLVPLGEFTRTYFAGYSGLHLMIYGAILILVVIFLPHGLISLPGRIRARFAGAGTTASAPGVSVDSAGITGRTGGKRSADFKSNSVE